MKFYSETLDQLFDDVEELEEAEKEFEAKKQKEKEAEEEREKEIKKIKAERAMIEAKRQYLEEEWIKLDKDEDALDERERNLRGWRKWTNWEDFFNEILNSKL